ncbi:MAG: AMP-binding protein [Paludibacter sp.]|nr:AMP-binding protein [Paludibacter sp.]
MNNRSIILNGKILTAEDLEHVQSSGLNSWQKDIYSFLKNWFDDSDVIITHTSGSTGKPKEIPLSKVVMRNSARMTNAFFGLDNTKTALLCLPASYIAGKMMLVRAIVGGFNLITIEPKANPFLNIETVIDFTAITPYQLNYSAETLKTASVKNIIVGGGHVNSKLEKAAEKISTSLYETYGMTETASHIALRYFNGKNKSEYFTALEGVNIAQDERGCLIIHAPHLSENKLTTNDIVEINEENQFKWLGRADSVINSGGIKVFPEQIEKILEEVIEPNYFIFGLPDDILGQKVVLFIETENIDRQKLLQDISQKLRKYEVPKEIFCIPKFVYSESNKILKAETLAKYQL